MITASHNPSEYNGFKIFNAKGESLEDSSVLLDARPKETKPDQSYRTGAVRVAEPEDYVKRLSSISLRKQYRIVLDAGNGATSKLAPEIFSAVAGSATAINSYPDGRFPGRGSEPTRESMAMLSRVVSQSKADIGIAFDGDGDRFYVVDENGVCPLQDRILASYLSFLAQETKGPFLIPVDASMAVEETVAQYGAEVVRGPVGDAKLLREMNSIGGVFAGEPSGAWIHREFHPCPDGILSGLLYLRQLEQHGLTVSKAVESVPEYQMVRKSVSLKKPIQKAEMEPLAEGLKTIIGNNAAVDLRFGLRASSDDSWILARESGTEPVLRVTAESKTLALTNRIVTEALVLINQFFGERI